ncbi:hypothetical protein ACUNEV_24910, partial [Serratia sp. IR-2025]
FIVIAYQTTEIYLDLCLPKASVGDLPFCPSFLLQLFISNNSKKLELDFCLLVFHGGSIRDRDGQGWLFLRMVFI